MQYDGLMRFGEDVGALAAVFRKKDKTETEPLWSSFAKRKEDGLKVDQRLKLLRSPVEIGKCYHNLSAEYRHERERFNAFQAIPVELSKKGVRLVFDFYTDVLLFLDKKLTRDVLLKKFNELHLFAVDNKFDLENGVLNPTRFYLEHLLQLTVEERATLQSVIFDALPEITQPKSEAIFHHLYYGKDDKVNFQDSSLSTMDKLDLNNFLLCNSFNPPQTFEALLMCPDHWMFAYDFRKLSKEEKDKTLDLLRLSSSSFRESGGNEELLDSNEVKSYLIDLYQYLLQNSDNQIIRMQAFKGLQQTLRMIIENDDPKTDRFIENGARKEADFLKKEYLPQASPEIKAQAFWLEEKYGSEFLTKELFPAIFSFLRPEIPDNFGFLQFFKTISLVRNQNIEKKLSKKEFLLECVINLSGAKLSEETKGLINAQEILPTQTTKFVQLLNKNQEGAEALELAGEAMIFWIKRVPLPIETYKELIHLWTIHKDYEDKDQKVNLKRNMLAMIDLEEMEHGCVQILMDEPFSIRFFDRYSRATLISCAKKFKLLNENVNKEGIQYQSKKTMLVTTTWYDNNDAFYSSSLNIFLTHLAENNINVIITEINSPASIFRSIKKLFELNGNNPFAANWIFRAHGGLEGGMRLGSENESESRVLPHSVENIITEKMNMRFGNAKVKLMLDSCYAGTNWVKKLGEKLNWSIFGPRESAGSGNYRSFMDMDGNLLGFDAEFFSKGSPVEKTVY